ncbi:hypothetical protein H6G33_12500 [Calothrix sp. FACHB-1219]|uniref:hypothetical protein n=1 Tax=unclassified Calothrix TaxID=2619626 RepID=UPI00168A36A7|nr:MULTISPECIES: hypothetical protein [unclassified Calothrix]MBD2202558.1 hypothetical protein [Calothrix sp. FACHB-168]MBD2217852.1 hypothetical protein [Calothrix sp. FACHB-1219]
MVNSQQSTVNSQQSTVNSQQSTVNGQQLSIVLVALIINRGAHRYASKNLKFFLRLMVCRCIRCDRYLTTSSYGLIQTRAI